jgi:hypothetical protein
MFTTKSEQGILASRSNQLGSSEMYRQIADITLDCIVRNGGKDSVSSIRQELSMKGVRRLGSTQDLIDLLEELGFTVEYITKKGSTIIQTNIGI